MILKWSSFFLKIKIKNLHFIPKGAISGSSGLDWKNEVKKKLNCFFKWLWCASWVIDSFFPFFFLIFILMAIGKPFLLFQRICLFFFFSSFLFLFLDNLTWLKPLWGLLLTHTENRSLKTSSSFVLIVKKHFPKSCQECQNYKSSE